MVLHLGADFLSSPGLWWHKTDRSNVGCTRTTGGRPRSWGHPRCRGCCWPKPACHRPGSDSSCFVRPRTEDLLQVRGARPPDCNHHTVVLLRKSARSPPGPWITLHMISDSEKHYHFTFSILGPHIPAGSVFIYERFHPIDIRSTHFYWISVMCQAMRAAKIKQYRLICWSELYTHYLLSWLSINYV